MNLFTTTSLITGISCFTIFLISFIYGRTRPQRIFSFFNLVISLWTSGCAIVGLASSNEQALLGWKIALFGGFFIAPCFYHFVCSWVEIERKSLIFIGYIQAIFLNFFNLGTVLLIQDTRVVFGIVYPTFNSLLFLGICLYLILVIISYYELWKFKKNIAVHNELLLKFILGGFVCGFIGGTSVLLPFLGIDNIYPAGNLAIFIYSLILTYAIFKYQWLDLRIAAAQFIIFVAPYFLVFCIPASIYFKFNLFAVVGLLVAVCCSSLAFITLAAGKTKIHRLLTLFNVAVAFWGAGGFIVGISDQESSAIFGWKIAHLGGVFVSILFFHLTSVFCKIHKPSFLIFGYAQAIIFNWLIWVDNSLFTKTRFTYGLYYNDATVFFYLAVFCYLFLVIDSFYELLRFYRKANGIAKNQTLYIITGFFIGFLGGTSTFLPEFGIDILYPFGNIGIVLYTVIVTYAILKYSLLDIKVVISRAGTFLFVYSFVLGIPFAIGFLLQNILAQRIGVHWWLVPTGICAFFATIGPFIFFYFQRKAEDALLQEEQRIQNLLMQASYGMNTIHNLQRLLELIVTIVVRTLRVDEGKIYLLNQEADKYELKIPAENNGLVIDRDAPLIEQLRQKQYPIVHDEMKMLSEMNGEAGLKEVENKMRELSAHMIVPITLKDSLIGFLALGERDSKDMYSRGLLNALSVLGRNAGLAIDRCNYIETETKRLEEESLKERIVSLDHMASSMAHEIDNPMVGVHSSLEYIRNILMRDPRVYIHEAVKEEWDETINRGLHCAERVSGMVKAILDYSRMGKGELKPVVIKEAVEGFQQLIGPEKKTEKVHLVVELEDNLPPILGDRIKLEQIFVNFVRNAIHAVKHKEQEERNVTLRIYKKDYKTIRVECIDNGYGIEKKLLNDMFLANTTTKGSSEGTGMGLYIVRQTVTTFGGRVWAESEGKDKGARLIAELPTYDGDRIAKIDTLKPKKEEKNGKDGQSKNQSPGA